MSPAPRSTGSPTKPADVLDGEAGVELVADAVGVAAFVEPVTVLGMPG